jgi:hypothetical protein
MHAMIMLHRMLAQSCAHIHAKRLMSLLAAVEAAVSGSQLTVSELGRGMPGMVAAKHNIKRIDRLLGNRQLHAEREDVYAALVRQCLSGVKTPLRHCGLVRFNAGPQLAIVARFCRPGRT